MKRAARCPGDPLNVMCRDLDPFDADLAGSGIADTELGRRGLAEIDDPPLVEGAPVIDRDVHRLAAPLIDHAYFGAERKRLVGGSHCVLVETLAGGRLLAVESRSIPGRPTALIACKCPRGRSQNGHQGGDHNDVSSQATVSL